MVNRDPITNREQSDAQNWTNLALGAWLFLSPWLLGEPVGALSGSLAAAKGNFWAVGALLAATSGLALRIPRPWEEWASLLLGLWLFFSPWILGYSFSRAHLWNAVTVGFVVVCVAAVAIPMAGGTDRDEASSAYY